MKKTFYLILAFVLLFGFIGCKSDKADVKKGSALSLIPVGTKALLYISLEGIDFENTVKNLPQMSSQYNKYIAMLKEKAGMSIKDIKRVVLAFAKSPSDFGDFGDSSGCIIIEGKGFANNDKLKSFIDSTNIEKNAKAKILSDSIIVMADEATLPKVEAIYNGKEKADKVFIGHIKDSLKKKSIFYAIVLGDSPIVSGLSNLLSQLNSVGAMSAMSGGGSSTPKIDGKDVADKLKYVFLQVGEKNAEIGLVSSSKELDKVKSALDKSLEMVKGMSSMFLSKLPKEQLDLINDLIGGLDVSLSDDVLSIELNSPLKWGELYEKLSVVKNKVPLGVGY